MLIHVELRSQAPALPWCKQPSTLLTTTWEIYCVNTEASALFLVTCNL